MRAGKGLPILLAGAVLISGGVALADTVRVSDPKGDLGAGTASRDLKSVGHGHTADGKLVHRIAVYGDIKVTPSKSPLMQIDTEGDSVAEYRVYVGPTGGGVIERQSDGTTKPILARKVSAHAMEYVFSPRKIGSPSSYDWDVLAVSRHGLVDRAPDASQITHDLTG